MAGDQYVYLIGAGDIRRAGSLVSSAADTMQRAASIFDETMMQHRQYMDEWLNRFENILNEHQKNKEE